MEYILFASLYKTLGAMEIIIMNKSFSLSVLRPPHGT